MRPPTITMMRLAKRNTTSMSCSMNRMVSSRDRPSMASNSAALSSFGTPAAGSSSSSTLGRVARASAISSSRCWPYGSSLVSLVGGILSESRIACASSMAPRKRGSPRHQLCALPSRSSTASATDSSALSWGNRVLIWKVRARPFLTRSSGFSRVISAPSRKIFPESGASIPVIRFISVVLPAPFGPIRAWRAPRGSSSPISCATTSEPKDLSRFLVESTYSAQDSIRQEHHHRHQQQADPEVPVLRVQARELVARHHVDDGADQAAVEPAGAAEDQDHQDVRRAAKREGFQRDRGSGVREQRAGDAGHHRGDGVGLAQVRAARRADRRHAHRVLADAAQGEAERGVNDAAGDQEAHEEDRQGIGVGAAAEHVEAKAEHRGHLESLQAVGAAGEAARAVGGLVQQQAQAHGEHDQREVAEAHDDVAGGVADEACGERSEEQTREGFTPIMFGEETGAVRADTEERGVAERDDARVAEDQVERQREERGDRDLAGEREIAWRQHERQQRAKPEHDFQRMESSACQTGPGDATSAARPSPDR